MTTGFELSYKVVSLENFYQTISIAIKQSEKLRKTAKFLHYYRQTVTNFRRSNV